MHSVENIIDSLFDKDQESSSVLSEDIVIPKRCLACKNTIICSVLPTLLSLSKIKIYVGIESCPFFLPSKVNATKDN
jgi:hypothetical protein